MKGKNRILTGKFICCYQKYIHTYYKPLIFLLYTLLVFYMGFISEKPLERYLTRVFHKPLVSVVMSTFNRAQALPDAIESILKQTFQDFEFIIIDDGSTDDTWNVIQSYAEKDSRIVALRNERNKGLIYSLNRGLDVARGKYIARMDDDDESLPFRLERQVLAMNEHPDMTVLGTDMLRSKDVVKKQSGSPVIADPDEVELNSYFFPVLAHPTVIMRRDFLNKHHLRYNPKYLYAEDYGLWKDVLNAGGKISNIKEVLLYFGVVKDVTRPPNYYNTSYETFKTIQWEKFKTFWPDIPYEWRGMLDSSEHKCLLLKKMSEANKTLKILNQQELDKQCFSLCEKEKLKQEGISVIHPQWKDYVSVNKNNKTFFRVDVPSETGKIMKEDASTVTVKWDHYDIETFRKEENGKKWVLTEN